jgi:hypothetical protein
MIWHIFKKDLRLHWLFAAGVAALGWIGPLVVYRADHAGALSNQQQAWSLMQLLIVGQLLASGILAATIVQSDALPGVRQDWLIRPIERRDLLLAKLLFVATLISGPVFIGDFVESLANSFSTGDALAASLLRGVCLLAAFYLPVLAFASITRNLTENIVAVVIAVAICAGLDTLINMMLPLHWQRMGSSGIDWIVWFTFFLLAAAGAGTILALQYFRRRVVAARWLTAAFGLLGVMVASPPWQMAFAVQQRLSPHPGTASPVNLEFQPSLGRYREPSHNSGAGFRYIRREEGATVYLPIHISGLGADSVLRTDLLQATVNGVHLTPVIPPVVRDGASVTHALVFVPAPVYSQLRDQPVRLELNYSLTLLRLAESHAVPSLHDWQDVPGFGRCETILNKAGTAVDLHCLMNSSTPPCATFFLEHTPTGRRTPATVFCGGQYTPFYPLFEPDPWRRAEIGVPFNAFVIAAEAGESRVVMRFYGAMDHFTRHLEIPDVRLSDWVAMQ